MYNCINEALEYLIEKYGEIQTPLSKVNVLMARTYNNSNISDDDKHIVRLMGQYYYGIQAKKDLYELLISLGLINLEVSN